MILRQFESELTCPPGVHLELTKLEFTAILSIVMEHYLASQEPDSEQTTSWLDVRTDQEISLEHIIALLSAKI